LLVEFYLPFFFFSNSENYFVVEDRVALQNSLPASVSITAMSSQYTWQEYKVVIFKIERRTTHIIDFFQDKDVKLNNQHPRAKKAVLTKFFSQTHSMKNLLQLLEQLMPRQRKWRAPSRCSPPVAVHQK